MGRKPRKGTIEEDVEDKKDKKYEYNYEYKNDENEVEKQEHCEREQKQEFIDLIYDLHKSLIEYRDSQGLCLCESLTKEDLQSFVDHIIQE